MRSRRVGHGPYAAHATPAVPFHRRRDRRGTARGAASYGGSLAACLTNDRRREGARFQSIPIITLEAFTIAYALAPGLSPSLAADCLVMIDTISIPGANSTTTSVSTAPGVTALTVAGKTLRALSF